jgi:hypothetical protein
MVIYIGPELHALERNRTRFPRSGCALSQLLERKTSARPAHIVGKFLGNFLLQILIGWDYNVHNAPKLCDAAGGSLHLFADRSGSVRIEWGLQPSGVLQARRKAWLRDDGEPICVVVRPLRAGCQMPFLSAR